MGPGGCRAERRFGDLDIAEEMAAEAFAVAVERWPSDGVPPNPGAWITTTANRRAIDRLRRESRRDDKQKEAQMLYDDTPPEPLGAIDDDRLRLIFTCCHPALAMEARIALTLRMVGGLTVSEIARAFLVQEATMGQRITRAKGKIKAARIPYRVPSSEDLPARISGVLAVLFLVFNEGYLASDPGKEAVRSDLTLEAIRLTRLLQALLPSDGEVAGLVALMLLTEARRPARISTSGELVTLDEQDRGAWDAALIAEGHALVRERIAAVSAGQGHPGRYQILAAINAGAHLRQGRTRHRLVPGRRSLRPARRHRPLTDRRAQSGRRARRARRARGGAGGGRQTGPERLPRLPRHPRRPATPTRPLGGCPRCVRESHRAGWQHRRGRVPHSPARPACDIDRHRRQSAQATGRTRTRPLKPSKLRRRWRQSFGRRSRQAQTNAVIGKADLQLCRCRKRVHLRHSDAKGRGTARTVEGC